jgi:hypothetical protein
LASGIFFEVEELAAPNSIRSAGKNSGGGLMKSKAKLLVVLVVIVSLVLAACAGLQPAPGIGGMDITGVWKWNQEDGEVYVQFNEDGTYRTAYVLAFLEKAPFDVGQFRLEGTSFTFITSDESWLCPGLTGSYEVELTEQGQLQFVLQEDACEMRGIKYPAEPWDRVEP